MYNSVPQTLKELSRLRWLALLVQLLVLLFVNFVLKASLPIFWLACLLALSGMGNLLFTRIRIKSDTLVGISLIFDVLILTALLALCGGPSNPFSVFFLMQVAVAAVFGRPLYTWIVVALSSIGFGILFFWHVPLPHSLGGHSMGHEGSFSIHLQGMWLAYTLTAMVIGVFVSRVSEARRMAEYGQQKAGHLLALATLAAGAAHEIGNPLGTIKLAVGELKRTLGHDNVSEEAINDLMLIDEEIERAGAVLRRMSQSAGELMGEQPRPAELDSLVEVTLNLLGDQKDRVTLVLEPELNEVYWPVQASAQAFQQLLKNALDASDASVLFKVQQRGENIRLYIEDQGAGMEKKILERVGEPFYTTGSGMGLGVFIARSLIQHAGGTLEIQSAPRKGTQVCVTLPRHAKGQR